MPQSVDDLPAEAERYVMPAHFVESDSLEVQGFVSNALRDIPAVTRRSGFSRRFVMTSDTIPIASRWMKIPIAPAESPVRRRRSACPRQSFLRPV